MTKTVNFQSLSREMEETAVEFSELKVHQPTILSGPVKFSLSLAPDSGAFEVLHGDSIVASGSIKLVEVSLS